MPPIIEVQSIPQIIVLFYILSDPVNVRLGQTSAVHFGSQLLSSLTGFVATLYIARELGGSVLGTYALFIAVLIWLKTFVGSGIHYAVTKRISESTGGGRELGAGLAIQTVGYFVCVLVLVIFRNRIDSYLGFDSIWILSVALATVLMFSFINATLRGEMKVQIAAVLGPLDRTTRSTIQLAVVFFGILGGGVVGLICGYIAGAIIASVAGALLISTRPLIPARDHLDRILEFTQYSWLSGIEDRAFSSMDTIILGVFVAPNFIGYYEVAWNLASILAIFGTSLAQTLFPAISELDSDNEYSEISKLISDSLAYSGLFLIPGFVGTVLISDVVLNIYGTAFKQAKNILILLVVARLIYSYESQFVSTLNALDLPQAAFRVNAVFVVTNLSLNLTLVWLYGWIGAAIATTTAATIGLVLGFYALRGVIEFSIPWSELVRQGGAAIAMTGAIIPLRRVVVGVTTPILDALILVGVGAGVYFVVLLAVSPRFRTTVRSNILT